MIVVDLEPGHIARAEEVARSVPGADGVTAGRLGVTIATADGAGLVGAVAVALANADVHPTALTVRTPSLDDVFLQATGYRMAVAEEAAAEGAVVAEEAAAEGSGAEVRDGQLTAPGGAS